MPHPPVVRVRKRYLDPQLCDRLREDLTFRNRAWYQAQRRGVVNLDSIPQFFYGYGETDDELILPAFLDWKKYRLPNPRVAPDVANEIEPVTPRVRYRPNQRAAAKALDAQLANGQSGILSLACGKGKTVLSVGAWAAMPDPVPGLAITTTKKIASQWIDRLTEFTDIRDTDIGFIGDGECSWEGKKFVVGLVQSLAGKEFPQAHHEYFGVTFFDECVDTKAFVPTLLGLKHLSDVVLNDYVLSFDETSNKFVYRRVTRVWDKGVKHTLKVITPCGSLQVTPEHMFLTRTGWKEAQFLQVGDHLVSIGNNAPRPQRVGTYYSTDNPLTPSWKLSTVTSPIAWPTNVPVLSVEAGPNIPVADIEVEGTHNFVANGVVVHNCHRLGAPYFSVVAGRYHSVRIGLSATWERADGLEQMFMLHLGKVFFEDRTQAVIPDIYFVKTPTALDLSRFRMWRGRGRTGEINHAKVITTLSRDRERHAFIIGHILDAATEHRKVLVLGDRKEELLELLARLPDGLAGLCVGTLDGRPQSAAIQDEALKKSVVLATSQLVKEGLDQPDIDTLFVLYPQSNPAFAEQAAGRILRQMEGKQPPAIVVFCDEGLFLEESEGAFSSRRTVKVRPFLRICQRMEANFKRLGYTIKRSAK